VIEGTVVLKALFEERRPVSQRARHHSCVDEIEFIGEGPWLFDIVNLESYVRRDTIPSAFSLVL
jgi:hypothetical protein